MFVPSLSAIASERMYTYCSVGPWSGASSINLDNYREALEHDKHPIVIDEPYDIRHHIASWQTTVVSETTISKYSKGYLPGAISNESTTAYNIKKPKVAQPLTRSNHEEGYVDRGTVSKDCHSGEWTITCESSLRFKARM